MHLWCLQMCVCLRVIVGVVANNGALCQVLGLQPGLLLAAHLGKLRNAVQKVSVQGAPAAAPNRDLHHRAFGLHIGSFHTVPFSPINTLNTWHMEQFAEPAIC